MFYFIWLFGLCALAALICWYAVRRENDSGGQPPAKKLIPMRVPKASVAASIDQQGDGSKQQSSRRDKQTHHGVPPSSIASAPSDAATDNIIKPNFGTRE